MAVSPSSGIFHEAGYFGEVVRGPVTGQGLDKNFTILHALDAVIEDGEDAAVGLRADQAAEALFEGEHRLGDLVFGKGVAAVLLKRADAGGDDRIAWHSKG